MVPLDRVETSTDTPIAVPPGLVWARIDVGEMTSDRIVGALFVSPYVWMDTVFPNGTSRRYRLVPAVARDGFLLSPLVGSPQDVVALMQGDGATMGRHAIVQFQIRVESPFEQPLGPRPVAVEFLRLEFQRDDERGGG